jgi:hypothetical protein
MGREAVCLCRWGAESAEVKALLEPRELVLRGAVRARIPVSGMRRLRVEGERLCFELEGVTISLQLGAAVAARWEAAIRKPPPSLAWRLGISAATRVRVLGDVSDPELAGALGTAASVSAEEGELIVAQVSSLDELHAVLRRTGDQRARGVPIWIVYPKGPKSPLGESAVRALLREDGMTDTKVASVSALLTALRFHRRQA